MMLERYQDNHTGYECNSGSLVHKGNSLVGPGGTRLNQSLQSTSNRKPKGVLPTTASDLKQMLLFSGEKLHSLYFQSPGKEGLTFSSGEELMLLKETWVLLGRAWTRTAESLKRPPCSPWKEFSFRSLWKGLLFLEFFVVVCFSLAFCFGLTVGMSLHP